MKSKNIPKPIPRDQVLKDLLHTRSRELFTAVEVIAGLTKLEESKIMQGIAAIAASRCASVRRAARKKWERRKA